MREARSRIRGPPSNEHILSKRTLMRTRLIEILLVLAVLLAVAVPVLRVIYGQSIRQWEREFFERIGINPELGWLLCGVIGFTLVVLRFRRKDRHGR